MKVLFSSFGLILWWTMALYKSVYFVTSEPIKNIGNLRNYFIEHTASFTTFHFPLAFLERNSYLEQYSHGKMVRRKTFPRYKGSNKVLKVVSHYLYFYITLLLYVEKGSVVITDNPLFCFLHSVPSFFRNYTFIFLIGDYFPDHTGLMWLYNKMADFYNQHSSHVIYLSPPIEELYTRKIQQGSADRTWRRQISCGIVRKFDSDTKDIHIEHSLKLGFIGVLRQGLGLDMAFSYVAKNPHAGTLEIIGGGYGFEYYKNLAKELGIEDKIVFHGFVDDPASIMRTWDIALALYEYTPGNPSIYCEPTKIKDYLSYGLPVITTKTTYLYAEIEKYGAGEVIEETVESLARAVTTITKEYAKYIQGVDRMVDVYEYKQWYDTRFDFLRVRG